MSHKIFKFVAYNINILTQIEIYVLDCPSSSIKSIVNGFICTYIHTCHIDNFTLSTSRILINSMTRFSIINLDDVPIAGYLLVFR